MQNTTERPIITTPAIIYESIMPNSTTLPEERFTTLKEALTTEMPELTTEWLPLKEHSTEWLPPNEKPAKPRQQKSTRTAEKPLMLKDVSEPNLGF